MAKIRKGTCELASDDDIKTKTSGRFSVLQQNSFSFVVRRKEENSVRESFVRVYFLRVQSCERFTRAELTANWKS